MGLTHELYKLGASSIASLQYRLPDSDGFFFTITKVSDPAYAFSILLPLTAALHTLLAADLLVASLMAEWSNTLLKWLFMEDRPYWWVREVEMKGLQSPILRQTPLTCETGPGSPSGHVMGATAVLYVLREWAVHYYIIPNEDFSQQKKRVLNVLSWALLTCSAVFVSLSRLYVATHFPHQCVLGFVLGLFVGRLLICKTSNSTWWWRRASKKHLLCIAVALSSISFGAYWFQRALGIDPQWSVRLAFKWCVQADYLHVDTTPLFSLFRDSGAAVGVALASPVHRPHVHHGSYVIRIGLAGTTILLFQILSNVIPTQQAFVFYLLHCMLQCLQAWSLLWLLPKIANLLPWPVPLATLWQRS